MTNVRQLQVYRENQITTTDSCTVLLMLYDGAIEALKRAVSFMALGDMAAKGQEILRANDIINQFMASLDYEVGGEIAQNLDGLYRYMLDQILLANVSNAPMPLSTVIALLSTLKSAWEEAIASQGKRIALGGCLMDCIIEALERVFAEGREIFACADGERRIQDWLARREEVFIQLNRESRQLADADKAVVARLIEAIRQLDASIIAKFQDRLSDLSDELAAARKLKGFLGAGGAAERPAFLRRSV